LEKVTHTNELCALALTHRDLHALVTPQIYSRFDIVWPEGGENAGPRAGVDALTFGLATLVMADDVFGEAQWQREQREHQAQQTGTIASPTKRKRPLSDMAIRRRRGNYYAQYIRKFSLGNGPKELVDDYLTYKEQGKMLGTLVALALARMKRLEAFIWDMPTGVLGDVWTSLTYLGERENCRLDRVWVRCHDNAALTREQSGAPESPEVVGRSIATRFALDRVVHPSFSELPPLKSLSVLDVDELQYLDEMAVLIERSLDTMRELRVGIAKQVKNMDWTRPWDGEGAEQIDHADPTRSTRTIDEKRLGGVMGVLTGRFYDLKQRNPPRHLMRRLRRRSSSAQLAQSGNPQQSVAPVAASSEVAQAVEPQASTSHDPDTAPMEESAASTGPATDHTPHSPMLGRQPSMESFEPSSPETTHASPPRHIVGDSKADHDSCGEEEEQEEKPTGDAPKLRLDILELEHVVLHLPVLENALDWTRLTSLTLLDCPNHEMLWRALRREYAPRDSSTLRIKITKARDGRPKGTIRRCSEPQVERTPLRLKHICTSNVSPSLVSFIKEALPENSLEAVYFTDPSGTTDVEIASLFRGVIKRHRKSLRRVYIESCRRNSSGSVPGSLSWKKWCLNRKILKFATSQMPLLRELGACVSYQKDWFYLLQRLPCAPQLRSLYIRRVSTYGEASGVIAPKDLAMQIMHTVSLRPAMELCYIGIMDKCFEIQEGNRQSGDRGEPGTTLVEGDDDDDDDERRGLEEDDEDEASEDDAGAHTNPAMSTSFDDDEETEAEDSGAESAESEDSEEGHSRFRLREILFYDDKVDIFRARHGRL